MMLELACKMGRHGTRDLIEKLLDRLGNNDFWHLYLSEHALLPPIRVAVHLAVFVEPFLGYVLDGRKTIESRFSINECPPFGVVREGDVLLVKKAGGSIVAISRVQRVWNYRLQDGDVKELRATFGAAMCAETDEFWQVKTNAACVTLMQLEKTESVSPVNIDKRDRRGWVVLKERSQQLLLWDE